MPRYSSDRVLFVGTARRLGTELPVRGQQPRGGGAVPTSQRDDHPGTGGAPGRTTAGALRARTNKPRYAMETVLFVSIVHLRSQLVTRAMANPVFPEGRQPLRERQSIIFDIFFPNLHK